MSSFYHQVTIEALNDSHQIGLCLYNVVILSAVGLTLSLLLDEHVAMLYGVTSGCVIIGTTVTQLVIFIPKVCTSEQIPKHPLTFIGAIIIMYCNFFCRKLAAIETLLVNKNKVVRMNRYHLFQ